MSALLLNHPSELLPAGYTLDFDGLRDDGRETMTVTLRVNRERLCFRDEYEVPMKWTTVKARNAWGRYERRDVKVIDGDALETLRRERFEQAHRDIEAKRHAT